MKRLLVEIHYEKLLWSFLQGYAELPNATEVLNLYEMDGMPISILLDCSEVHQDGSFVRLVPYPEETIREYLPEAISVPVDLIAWIAESGKSRSIGFVNRQPPNR